MKMALRIIYFLLALAALVAAGASSWLMEVGR